VLLAAGLYLALMACAGPGSDQEVPVQGAEGTSVPGGPDEMSLIEAHKALIGAMETGDVAALTALVDPSHELLIFHPFVHNRFEGIEEVDAGLSRMFEHLGSVSWTEAHAGIALEGNVGWVTSHVVIKSAALPGAFVGRGTEIWIHGPGGWRLNHAHWSENAELAGSISDGS
jgi:ketosteroid isomerase-like protein